MSYIISLDAVDLQYLPITKYSRENKVKLFDVSSAKKHDYIEFEIFASKKSDEAINETIPPYCTIICQICNISIPTCYIIEHNQSSKHKMYKSIMDNALERAKKYLNDDNTVPDTKRLPHAYFCDVCCLPLLNSEKEIHEKSQKHCEELKKEMQLNDFLKHLYSLTVLVVEDFGTAGFDSISSNLIDKDLGDPDDVNSDFKLVEPEVNTGVQLKVKPKKRYSKKQKQQLQSKSELTDETLVEPVIKTEIEPKIEKKDESKQNILGPMEAMLDKASILRCDGIIEIELPDGKKVYIPEQKYNGIFSVTKDITICLLCSEFVKNSSTHKESPKHLDKIKVSVKDTNCIRQLEDKINHCLLCNEVFADVHDHISNKLHLSSKIDSSSLFATLHNENCKPVSEVNHNFPDYYHFEIHEQLIACKVCNLTVNNSVEVARKHVASISHDEKYKELLKSNRLTHYSDYYFKCNFCNNHVILKGTELFHIVSNDHKFVSDNQRKTEQYFNLQTPSNVGNAVKPEFELNRFDWPKL